MNDIAKFFSRAAISVGRSLLLSEVKGGVKSFLNSKRAKSLADIQQEMMKSIGYTTSLYSINPKTQELTYKSSPLFIKEWLTNTPSLVGRLIKDEETGQMYFNGALLTNAHKSELINDFIKQTGVKSPALLGHFDNACKLLPIIDINSLKFNEVFGNWNVNNASVIDNFLNGCFGITDPLMNKLFRKWIIGTARRITNPGSSLDGCLVLKSLPGRGKTQFFRQLIPAIFSNRVAEVYCNIKSPQKFLENIIGKSIVNFDELSPLDYPQTTEIFKQLLSSQNINVRLAWHRSPTNFALRNSFGATTNKNKFIVDPTLSRRLWVINIPDHLERMSFTYLEANKHKLWQEALYYASTQYEVFLTADDQLEVENYNNQFIIE